MSEKEAFLKLQDMKQQQLIPVVQQLPIEKKRIVLDQIAELSDFLLHKQQLQLQKKIHSHRELQPFKNTHHSGNAEDQKRGRQLVFQGKAALVVLAGGQGSRLKHEGPKGTVAVSPVCHKSLYQMLSEKVMAAGIQIGRDLHMHIMTSPLNHQSTVDFFKTNRFFGLQESQVTFFCQKMWPLLDFSGDLFIDEEGKIAFGPNGNGGLFRQLLQSGTLDKWQREGIEMIQCIPIDNPLALPFDYELFGCHIRHQHEITVKVCKKNDPEESVGVLAIEEGRPTIVEYYELDSKLRHQLDEEGNLTYGLANLGLFCFSLCFMKKAARADLPLHFAKKAIPSFNERGVLVWPKEPNAWKFEEFIFDVLPLASSIGALVCERSSCFAPLKNLTGADSIETVREALIALDQKIFAQITRCSVPKERSIELAAQFYYPTDALLKKWKNRNIPDKDYIDE